MKEKQSAQPPATLGRYIAGYVMSLVLTLTAYLLVRHHLATHHQFPPDNVMEIFLAALAIIQLLVQVDFFLHLTRGSKPRWNMTVAAFVLIVLVIIVGGSLWIMHNLNYRMMPSQKQVDKYMQSQDGL